VNELKNQNLRLEKLDFKHAEQLFSLLNDPIISRWLGGSKSIEDIDSLIKSDMKRWNSRGYGTYLLTESDKEELVARAGVREAPVLGVGEVELFYTVSPKMWGMSIAPSVAASALATFYNCCPDSTVYSFTLPINLSSIRVMQKLGFSFKSDLMHADMNHVLYELKCADLNKKYLIFNQI